MKRGDVYDYETGELIRKGTDEVEHGDITGGRLLLYILGGFAKVLGIVFLGVFGFIFGMFTGIKK